MHSHSVCSTEQSQLRITRARDRTIGLPVGVALLPTILPCPFNSYDRPQGLAPFILFEYPTHVSRTDDLKWNESSNIEASSRASRLAIYPLNSLKIQDKCFNLLEAISTAYGYNLVLVT